MNGQNTESLMWLGAGDLSRRFESSLQGSNRTFKRIYVSRSVRPNQTTPNPTTPSQAGDCQWLQSDLARPGAALSLAQLRPEYCVLSFSPKGRREEDYDHAYLKSVEQIVAAFSQIQHAPRLLIFISSTSIYPQNSGEWVNEDAAESPSSHSGKTMQACEQLLAKQNYPTCALRFSGIYGPGRFHLLKQVEAGKGGSEAWTNRIHAEDCAAIIGFLLELAAQSLAIPPVLLASDDQPVPANELRRWLATQMQINPDTLVASPSIREPAAVGLGSEGRMGKRCQNSRLKSLGYRLMYPSYKEGFPDIIKAFNE